AHAPELLDDATCGRAGAEPRAAARSPRPETDPSPWVLDAGEGSASGAGRRACEVAVVGARRGQAVSGLQATRASDDGQHAASVTGFAGPGNRLSVTPAGAFRRVERLARAGDGELRRDPLGREPPEGGARLRPAVGHAPRLEDQAVHDQRLVETV